MSAEAPRSVPAVIDKAFAKTFAERFRQTRTEFLIERNKRATSEINASRDLINDVLGEFNAKREGRTSARIPAWALAGGPVISKGKGAKKEKNASKSMQKQSGVSQCSSETRGVDEEGGDQSPSSWSLALTDTVRVRIGKSPSTSKLYKAYKIPKAATIPPYTAWIYISKNERDQDNDKRMFYTDEQGETVPASDEEVEYEFWYWNGKDLAWRDFCLKAMLEQLGNSKELKEALAEKFKVDSDAIEARFREISLPDDRSETVRESEPVEETLEAYNRVFCRRCKIYGCRLHGGGHVIPRKPAAASQAVSEDEEACSESCFKLGGQSSGDGMEIDKHGDKASKDAMYRDRSGGDSGDVSEEDEEDCMENWTAAEKGLVSQALEVFGPNPCEIFRFINTKSCAEISEYLKSNPTLLTVKQSRQNSKKKVTRRKPYNSKKGPLVVQKRFRHNEAELWHQYTSCNCKGGCNSSCSCVKTKNFCEKYCACWPGCANQWKGCKCSHRCDTQRCPCVSASRECDPDYCAPCRKTCEPNCPSSDQCKNMNLRLRRHKRVAMGLSTVAGWGGFLMENAKKDDFLGEYTGDLISDQEAERRGRIYDRQDKSYLFNLTKEGVLDANRRGNKLRFANHSKDPNCYVKYMLVDGDHRVGIFAGRDVKPGEEIFYDYGGAWCSKWYDPEGERE